MFIRNHKLESFSDGELETGEFSFGKKSHQAQSYYLAYLILAEVQEGLLQHFELNRSVSSENLIVGHGNATKHRADNSNISLVSTG